MVLISVIIFLEIINFYKIIVLFLKYLKIIVLYILKNVKNLFPDIQFKQYKSFRPTA